MSLKLEQASNRIRAAQWCETISTAFLFGFALAAPHSIAGSQGGFLIAALFWALSCAFKGRIDLRRTPLDLFLLGFFAWAAVSAAFSYEPAVSFRGLKALAFLSAFYLISTRASEGSLGKRLAITLVISSLFNVGCTIVQKARGEGLRIDSMAPRSRLIRVGLMQGDVLLKADGMPVKSLSQLSDMVDAGPAKSMIKLDFRRGEIFFSSNMTRRRIQKIKNASGPDRFGVEVSRARDFRSHGFYNHYATYAESLQLIGSLAFGLLLSCPRKNRMLLAGLALCGVGFVSALIFTATRAPLVGLMVSLLAMALMAKGARRAAIAALILIALPIGIYAITKWRGVGFIDAADGSTSWRLEIWREGLGLVKMDPIFGIGRGSERTHWREWGLYRGGELPPGHFHSTPLQIAVWWGLPALFFYIGAMAQALRSFGGFLLKTVVDEDWLRRAIILGAFGGLIGFNVSSLVHFNFGDGEVTMILWLIMGLGMAGIFSHREHRDHRESN